MTELDRVASDLRFVRGVLASTDGTGPASIYFLWAAASLVGFALMDISHELVGPYWTVVAPVGFAISLFLGGGTHTAPARSRRRTVGARPGIGAGCSRPWRWPRCCRPEASCRGTS